MFTTFFNVTNWALLTRCVCVCVCVCVLYDSHISNLLFTRWVLFFYFILFIYLFIIFYFIFCDRDEPCSIWDWSEFIISFRRSPDFEHSS